MRPLAAEELAPASIPFNFTFTSVHNVAYTTSQKTELTSNSSCSLTLPGFSPNHFHSVVYNRLLVYGELRPCRAIPNCCLLLLVFAYTKCPIIICRHMNA